MRVSSAAKERIVTLLQDFGGEHIRITSVMAGGGCCLTCSLGITVDDSCDDEDDITLVVEGIPFVIDKALHDRLGDISISFDPEKGISVAGSMNSQ